MAPLIATALLDWAGSAWPIAACMAGTSLLGLVAMLAGRLVETGGTQAAYPTPQPQ